MYNAVRRLTEIKTALKVSGGKEKSCKETKTFLINFTKVRNDASFNFQFLLIKMIVSMCYDIFTIIFFLVLLNESSSNSHELIFEMGERKTSKYRL